MLTRLSSRVQGDYLREGESCLALSRQCVGDFEYGFPLPYLIGYNGDYDVYWMAALVNFVFWSLATLIILFSIRRLLHRLYG